MSADVRFNERLSAERVLLRRLDLKELEALAIESQAMVDRALAAARATLGTGPIIDVVTPPGPGVADAKLAKPTGDSHTIALKTSRHSG